MTQLDMTPRLDKEALLLQLRNSAFNKTSYGVDIALNTFLQSMSLFTHGETEDDEVRRDDLIRNPTKLFECVPAFQRSNNQWTEAMQVKFVENLLSGLSTVLMLYEVVPLDKEPLRTRCKVLDGLQRLTAIYRFIRGDLLVFGYSYDELVKNRIMRMNLMRVKLQVYSFDTEKEAVEFYIAMNENITHSSDDIQKARDYIATLE